MAIKQCRQEVYNQGSTECMTVCPESHELAIQFEKASCSTAPVYLLPPTLVSVVPVQFVASILTMKQKRSCRYAHVRSFQPDARPRSPTRSRGPNTEATSIISATNIRALHRETQDLIAPLSPSKIANSRYHLGSSSSRLNCTQTSALQCHQNLPIYK